MAVVEPPGPVAVKRIGGGIARADAAVAGVLHRADALVDGHAGDVAGDFPTQRGGLAALNRGGLGRELRHGRSGRRGGGGGCTTGGGGGGGGGARHLLLAACREHRQRQRQPDDR